MSARSLGTTEAMSRASIFGLGLGTAACLVIGGIGLVASVVAFAAWARKQIVRWGELIRPLFPTPPGQGTRVDRPAG